MVNKYVLYLTDGSQETVLPHMVFNLTFELFYRKSNIICLTG